MIKYLLALSLLILAALEAGSQNYFQDPTFDEPQAPADHQGPCMDRGITFDKFSKVYSRIANGSPDIIVPIEEDCKLHVKNPLVQSQCVGLVFGNSPSSANLTYKEPLVTQLRQPTSKGERYKISFDILCNPGFYVTDTKRYQPSYFNVVLASSYSDVKDTLFIPVSADSHSHWDRSQLIFTSEEEFNIVRFDLYADDFFGSDHDLYLNVILDNFELVSTTDEPITIEKSKPLPKQKLELKQFTYYFDSNESQLSAVEEDRLLADIQSVSLQGIQNISIHAYTDSRSSVQFNQKLSKRRAESIQNILQSELEGSSIRYITEGKGIDHHLQDDKARRVEVNITYASSEIAPWYRTSNRSQSSFNYHYLGNTDLGKRRDRVALNKEWQEGNIPNLNEKPFDADRYIIAKARRAKILIINESHTYPSHRAYISTLLPRLKSIGYSMLAVEALQVDNDPHSLTMKDPVFLRYLLHAQQMGYELISYDNKSSIEPDWHKIKKLENVEYAEGYGDLSRDMNIRDYNEFLNLEDDIDGLADEEKIIIHVGHRHGRKSQIDQWKPLGAYLVEKYGEAAILSVDQVTLNNCITRDSNDYYNHYKPSKPLICASGQRPFVEKVFSPLTFSFESVVDIQVLHPSTACELSIDTSHAYVQHNDIPDATYPLAIMIYEDYANPRTDVAYSAIEVENRDDVKASTIPNSGQYQILVKDGENRVLKYDIVKSDR